MNGEGLDISCHASGPVLAQQTELVIFAPISRFQASHTLCFSDRVVRSGTGDVCCPVC